MLKRPILSTNLKEKTMNSNDMDSIKSKFITMLDQAGIVLQDNEKQELELAGLGLGHFAIEGLGLIVYANTDRYCAKELIMLPNQTCPEHRHPTVKLDHGKTEDGKMETFRCRSGSVYLYVDGSSNKETITSKIPVGSEAYYTVFHEVILKPGDQYTINPNTLHWFQAGPQGAIISEFSSTSRDELDIFTDPRINRIDNSIVSQ